MTRPIALFTDFGTHDIYVGQLHASAKRSGWNYPLLDLFHDVNAFDIDAGASLLAAMLDYLPRDVIVIGVVDPGVGGSRLPIAVELGERLLVGPDNGLFSRAVAWSISTPQYWVLEISENVAKTFHGRDVFLPAAIQLARGSLEGLHRLDDLNGIWTHRNAVTLEGDDCRVIHIDHYGNLISGIRGTAVKTSQTVKIAGQKLDHFDHYECVARRECFWYVNSIGLLEISANQASAAQILDVQWGAEFIV